jgi:hypothetical protein
MNAALKLTCALALLSPLPAQEWNLNVYGAVAPAGWIDGRPAFAVFSTGYSPDIFLFRNPAGTTHEVGLYIHDLLAIDSRSCAQGETAAIWRSYYGGTYPEAVIINGLAFTGFGHSSSRRMVWGEPLLNSSGWNRIGVYVGSWVPLNAWPCHPGGCPEASIVLFTVEIVR